MRTSRLRGPLRWLAPVALLLAPAPAGATDGLYLSSRGAPSAGMAGATTASGHDPLAQTLNPASLAVTPPGLAADVAYLNTQIDFHNAGSFGPGVPGLAGQPFQNDAWNAQDVEYFPFQDNHIFAPMAGLVLRAERSQQRIGFIPLRDLTLGLSIYGAGGDAARFHMDHPVLGRDTLFRTNQLVGVGGASLAWAVTDWLSVGGTLQLTGARLRLAEPVSFDIAEFSQGTTPFLQGRFFRVGNFAGLFDLLGMEEGTSFTKFTHGGVALGVGGRFGVRVQPLPWLTLGAAYQLRRKMVFEGRATLDFTPQIEEAAGLVIQNPRDELLIRLVQTIVQAAYGSVTIPNVIRGLSYVGLDPELGFVQTYDAQIPFALPQQVNVGAAVQLTPRWLFELDYTWIDWSRDFDAFRIHFRNGSNPNLNTIAGTDHLDFSIPLRWRDQHIVSAGTSWAVSPDLTLRLGYRWASEPIRPEGHVLTIPAAGFHAVSVGAGIRLSERVDLDLAFERAFPETIRVGASDVSSFQANSTERTSEYAVHVQLGVRLGGAPRRPPEPGLLRTLGVSRQSRRAGRAAGGAP